MKINEHRQTAAGLPDLLLYASLVDDGVVLLQDGCLLAAWSYHGPDLASSTNAEMSSLAARLNSILRLGSGWMIQCDAFRTYAPAYPNEGAFPDPVTRLIDRERREQFTLEGTHLENEYFLCLTYMPPLQKEERLAGFVFEGAGRQKSDVATRILNRFKAKVLAFQDVLSSLVRCRRLGIVEELDQLGNRLIFDDLLRYIRRCVNGRDFRFALPAVPMFLHDLIGYEDFVAGMEPRIGENYLQVLALDTFPAMSYPGILAALDALPFPYRWNTRAITLDPEVGRALVQKRFKKWRGSVRGFFDQLFNRNGVVNQFANDMTLDAETALSLAASGDVHFCYFAAHIILLNPDREVLRERTGEVRKTLESAGFGVRIETVNAVEAWRGTLPGDGYSNVRRILAHTLNLADCMPISAIWPGERHCPCRYFPPKSPPLLLTTGQGATPFRVNCHVDDVGHTTILGPTGSGKSTLLALLAAQFFRYEDARVIVVDKGKSMYVLNRACGGAHYDLQADGIGFAPLQALGTASDRAWAGDYLETLCILGGLVVEPKHTNAIADAIHRMAESRFRSLTDFLATVQNGEVRAALTYYTIKGTGGQLLDARQDSLADNRFLVFEMESLMGSGNAKNRMLVAALLYLFRQIEKRATGKPTLLILDEAWVYLSHPLFQEKIKDWLKTMRRKNVAVILATQSLSDVLNSPICDVVIESCPTKILLPNVFAGVGESRALYEKLGLNEREIAMLANATPKRHYYFTSPVGKRMVTLGLGGVALSFVGASSEEDRASAERVLEQAHGDASWIETWLRVRGVETGNPSLQHWAKAAQIERERISYAEE